MFFLLFQLLTYLSTYDYEKKIKLKKLSFLEFTPRPLKESPLHKNC